MVVGGVVLVGKCWFVLLFVLFVVFMVFFVLLNDVDLILYFGMGCVVV